MSSRARQLCCAALLCLLVVPPRMSASASTGDHDPDKDVPAAAAAPPRQTGKPVPFQRAWLTPFFQQGRAKQAVEQFRAEDWDAAEASFAKALRSLSDSERHAAKYMLALARTNLSKWADAGRLFEQLYKEYPKLAPYHQHHQEKIIYMLIGKKTDTGQAYSFNLLKSSGIPAMAKRITGL
jgi:TolA-binding protein